MKVVQKLLGKLNGLHYRQEYLCLALERFTAPLNLYLVNDGKVTGNITAQHIFVGYCPVIFALPLRPGETHPLHIVCTSRSLNENEAFDKKDVSAELIMEKIREAMIDGTNICFYKGIGGKHHFLSFFSQWIIGLNNSWFNKKTGNVFLRGNLLKQVQIAYAIPRKICLITVGKNSLYNLFPTDLHGQIGDQHYVISLRHEGKACQQVMETKQVLLSDMSADSFKKVYALGKNHMQPLRERSAFDFSVNDSERWHLPRPNGAVAYKELKLVDSFQEGIHRLLIFRIEGQEKLTHDPETLGHIHNVYATWREKNGLRSNYLLR